MEVKKKKKQQQRRRHPESEDDWAFLEDIDAPMWVDLSLESITKDNDDDDDINATWFELFHPFHQLSSYHFLNESSSSKPSSSVSKSRGKHYRRNRKWTTTNNHPINTFSSPQPKPKPKPHPLPQLTTKSSHTSSNASTSTSHCLTSSHPFQTKLSFSASNTSIKSKPTTSRDGLLLSLRASLRRSHVTRQPVRVELKHRNSSSTLPSTTISPAPTLYRIKTPQSNQVSQFNFNISHKVKHVNKMDGQRRVDNFRSGKPVCQETSKHKTSLHLQYKKSSPLQNVQNSYTYAKKPTTNTRNATGQMFLSQGTASKENNIGSLLWPQKASKHTSVGKTEDALDPKGSDNGRKVGPRIYLR